MKLQLSITSIVSLAHALQPAHHLLDSRQSVCPVACGQGWCCQIGTKCIPGKDPQVKYDCDDFLLSTTWPAINMGILTEIPSVISQAASGLTLSTTFSVPSVSIPSGPTTTPGATRSGPTAASTSNAAVRPVGVCEKVGMVVAIVGAVLA
ncbi:hypothetical protein B0T25DRAFT_354842 [Lasiosphaeria hispida]|uniref:Uncharacterized protein n=1 Tax=Lasiosphaeria hispida TaxID=260671 RepID=A0AAJ0H788_9PEZI|nr:hypothetical protein B0T25DRAFT_354842 [Lasiosphaeria hispida]